MSNKLLMRFLPFLAWFPVSTIILRGDLIAGITGALVLVPKAMAYARLSGLPLYFGLYTAFVPAILGALWGSSRQLATGPVAIITASKNASASSAPNTSCRAIAACKLPLATNMPSRWIARR